MKSIQSLGTRIFPSCCHHRPAARTSTRSFASCSQHALLQFRSSRLGFLDPLIESQLDQIAQLPEIATALATELPDANTITGLERALEILQRMSDQAPYRAALALMAETQCAVAGSAADARPGEDRLDYSACIDTLWKIKNLPSTTTNNQPNDDNSNSNNNNRVDAGALLDLAQAKAHWLNGEFVTAKGICDLITEDADTHRLQVVSRTGQAVTRLCAVQVKDDVFSVRDPFRMAFKRLEYTPRDCHTALAAACLNLGVAEAVWAETVKKFNPEAMQDVPLDASMRMWNQGLMTLESAKKPRGDAAVANRVRALLEARLHTCMAWGMANMPHFDGYVDDASEYASKALAVYDKNPALQEDGNQRSNKEGLTTTLSILATCYHKSGSAVTAEGLLQTAIDQPLHSPLQRLELRNALTCYAELCRDWDKRESEAAKLKERAKQVDAMLPPGWSGKSVIHSSLWFWTPALFDY